jgi:hypothetical protein
MWRTMNRTRTCESALQFTVRGYKAAWRQGKSSLTGRYGERIDSLNWTSSLRCLHPQKTQVTSLNKIMSRLCFAQWTLTAEACEMFRWWSRNCISQQVKTLIQMKYKLQCSHTNGLCVNTDILWQLSNCLWLSLIHYTIIMSDLPTVWGILSTHDVWDSCYRQVTRHSTGKYGK